MRVVSGGQNAARLRCLRRFAGPVPPWYPDARPVAGPIRGVRERVWRAAGLVAEFGKLLIAAAAGLPHGPTCPLVSEQQLAWGVRYRPSPSDGHVTMHLPAQPAAGPAHLDVPARAARLRYRDRGGAVHRDPDGAADLARHP